MAIAQSTLIWSIIFYTLIPLSGIWLRRAGKPYSTIVLTLHKLISLAAVIVLVTDIVQTHGASPLGAPQLIVIVLFGVVALAAIASGGLISLEKPMPSVFVTLHLITSVLIALAVPLILFSLLP